MLRDARVCSGMLGCARVCKGMRGCARVCKGVQGDARGVRGCARGVRGCARVCEGCARGVQGVYEGVRGDARVCGCVRVCAMVASRRRRCTRKVSPWTPAPPAACAPTASTYLPGCGGPAATIAGSSPAPTGCSPTDATSIDALFLRALGSVVRVRVRVEARASIRARARLG